MFCSKGFYLCIAIIATSAATIFCAPAPVSTVLRNCLPGWVYSETTGMCHNITQSLNFKDAKAACSNYGGQLASIHSIEANNFLSYMARSPNSSYVWIGIYAVQDAPCRWAWLDCSEVKFQNWIGDGEAPKTCADMDKTNWIRMDTNSRCATMIVDINSPRDWTKSRWVPNLCFNEFPALCQMAPIETAVEG
ncbi:Protein CLEC-53 [Aphelenchoides avenae]|nr:Protein CLEC-53 [Aphelenchus avenae]